jgi:hypothetical protein
MQYTEPKKYSIDPESVPVKGWAGRIMFHGTSKKGAESIYKHGIKQNKSNKGYFGRGFYMASDYDLAKSNYADFSEDEDGGAVITVKIKDNANILDLRDAIDSEKYMLVSKNGRLIGDDNFDKVMVTAGVDGLFDRSFGGVVIYNAKAIEVLK